MSKDGACDIMIKEWSLVSIELTVFVVKPRTGGSLLTTELSNGSLSSSATIIVAILVIDASLW
jgi:hypothetical protein